MPNRAASVELKANCGCGEHFTGSPSEVLAAAERHSEEWGHTMEIQGTVQSE